MKFLEENYDYIVVVMIVITIFILGANTIKLAGMHSGVGLVTATPGEDNEIIPTGTPPVYGEELGIKYDMVSPYNQQLADQVINKLSQLDRQITLEEEDNQRYINILYRMGNGISCEYCCGAQSVIFENGQKACGCAHSYAMRGVAKYLLTEHGDEFTDAEIFKEVAKWKTLFFPTQIQQKAKILEDKGIEVDYLALTSNKYRGIEKGLTGGGMVGGC